MISQSRGWNSFSPSLSTRRGISPTLGSKEHTSFLGRRCVLGRDAAEMRNEPGLGRRGEGAFRGRAVGRARHLGRERAEPGLAEVALGARDVLGSDQRRYRGSSEYVTDGWQG